jgi:diguanylate cyclase (GGDEF)-like protein/PAS domain S-box-containing protein
MTDFSAQIFASLWEHTPDAAVLTDHEGRVLAANPACLQLSGLPPDAITGQHFAILFPPESRLALLAACQPALDLPPGASDHFECEVILRDGRTLHMEVACTAISDPADGPHRLFIFRDITSRKELESQLSQSEERFRTLADYTSDWVYWVDPEGSYIYISPSVERITGYPAQAFYQEPSLIFEITHPDDRSIMFDIFQTSLISSQPLTAEFRIRTASQEERWIDHISLAVAAPDGRYLGRRAANRDNTRQKALQNSLRRQVEIEQILAEISTLFLNVSASQVDVAIQRALLMVGEHSGANRCFILDYAITGAASDGATLQPTHQWRRSEVTHRDDSFRQLILSDPPGSENWLPRRDVLEYARDKLPCTQDNLGSLACAAIIVTPLMRSGKTSGYIGMTASALTPAWGPSEHLLLRLTGELVISALDRQRNELELERTTRQLSVILEGVADAITVLDASGKLVYANTAAAQAAGLRSVDEIYQSLARARPYLTFDAGGKPLQTGELPAQSLLAGKSHPDRVLRLRPLNGGNERWQMVRSRPVFDNQGRIQYAVTISHDITTLKEAEDALRTSGTLYQTTIDAIQDGLMVVDRSLTILLCNQSMRRWAEELNPGIEPVGAQLFDAFPFIPRNAGQEYERIFNTGEGITLEEHVDRRDHSLVIHTHLIPITENKQVTRIITLVRDVTLQFQEEERIQIAAWRADLLAGLSRSITEAGLDDAAIYEAITGYLSENTGDACLLHIPHPDTGTFQLAEAAFPEDSPAAALQQMAASLGLAPDGPLRTVFQSGMPILLPAGQPGLPEEADGVRLVGVISLPLYHQARVFAALTLLRYGDAEPHKRADLLFFQDIAHRVSLAIENSRLYALQAQRARELDALNQATAALLVTLDLEQLLGKILDAAKTAIPAAERGEIRLLSSDTGELELRAASSYRDKRISYLPAANITPWMKEAINSRQPLLIAPAGDEDPQAGSLLVAPMHTNLKALGVLLLTTAASNAFGEPDQRLLGSLATTAAAALQNARLHALIQRQAITDELTSLYNRRGLFAVGEREVARSHRFNHPLSAILLDIDDFKHINDTYGHLCGDQVLRQVAHCLETNLRSIDIIGRYGGDEFVILLPETDLFTAAEVAERLSSRVREMYVHCEAALLNTSISMGVTRVIQHTKNLEALFDQADRALYQAKQRGKDCVEIG